MGAGGGHVARLVPIIRAFLDIGWHIVAAVRDVRRARVAFAGFAAESALGRFAVAQAPIFTHRAVTSAPVRSVAGLLCAAGMDRPELVRPVVGLWEQLIAKAKPALIISDTAPCLHLAARERVPVICIGNGWTIPPAGADPFPGAADLDPHAAQAHQRLLDAVHTIRPDSPWLDGPAALLRGDRNFVFTPPIFDPYRHDRADPHHWPPEISGLSETSSSSRDGPGLIYLPGSPSLSATVAAAVERRDGSFGGYFGPGSSVSANRSLRVSLEPIPFASALPVAPLIIHHGGLGTAIAAAQARVPQLILFGDLEKAFIGRAVTNGGYGLNHPARIDEQTTSDLVDQIRRIKPPMFDRTDMATGDASSSLRALVAAANRAPVSRPSRSPGDGDFRPARRR
jgi:UDP:flavonoid glycosyltransferase YjiC (YdhE family)